MSGVSTPGVGVVARAMIAVEQPERAPAAVDFVFGAVSEGCARETGRAGAQHALVRDAAKRHHRIEVLQRSDALEQEGPAGRDLGRRWLVGRRHAADRVGEDAIDQRQPVIRPLVVMPLGETPMAERLVQQVAGPVAREWTPGHVRPVQARRQADDEQPRIRGPERAYGTIVAGRELAAVVAPELRQPRTQGTIGRGLAGHQGLAGPSSSWACG